MAKRLTSIAAVAAASALLLSGCAASDTTEDSVTTVSFRLWDETVADAYEESIAAFEEANPGIRVKLDVVPWDEYWSDLRTDVAGGTMDDLFWINDSYYGAYVDSGNLVDVGAVLGDGAKSAWEPTVVEQFTRDDTLWGVPQTYDAGIGLYYNADLLDAAGLDASDLEDLEWSPDADEDTFLPLAQRLTLDSSGRSADQDGFDAGAITQYGTNLAYDLQAILLPYIGSNGGTFQDEDGRFTFTDEKTAEVFSYLVDAIDTLHVAPAASDTNENSDYSLDAFTQGSLALFQSGVYNLKNLEQDADFDWGVAAIPSGPEGRVSVTNGIVVAGNAASEKQDAIKKVLGWFGSAEGNSYLGKDGAAVPAVVEAQKDYFAYWESHEVDVSPFFDVIDEAETIATPVGADFEKGFDAYDPIFKQIFAGDISVKDGLEQAQAAANAAIAVE